MNSQPDGTPDTNRTGQPPASESLTLLANEVDRQLVLDLGGEFLKDSGFESETPVEEFQTEDQGHA